MDLKNLPSIKHPFANCTLADAVDFAVSNAKTFGKKIPSSMREVRDYIEDMAKRCDHNWITGAVALDVLDAAIDGKDIRMSSRY